LVESLQSKEPFTVFKAIDAVFSVKQLEVDKLLKLENKAKLSRN
jgi:uncharacterized surface protein with fasciclin (FAS1) repeats